MTSWRTPVSSEAQIIQTLASDHGFLLHLEHLFIGIEVGKTRISWQFLDIKRDINVFINATSEESIPCQLTPISISKHVLKNLEFLLFDLKVLKSFIQRNVEELEEQTRKLKMELETILAQAHDLECQFSRLWQDKDIQESIHQGMSTLTIT